MLCQIVFYTSQALEHRDARKFTSLGDSTAGAAAAALTLIPARLDCCFDAENLLSGVPLMLLLANLGTTRPSLAWQAHLGVPTTLQDLIVVSILCVLMKSPGENRWVQAISDWLTLS